MERRGPRRPVDEGGAGETAPPPVVDPHHPESAPPATAAETGRASEVALQARQVRWEKERRRFEATQHAEGSRAGEPPDANGSTTP
jgi:hypothetical protein